uniref:MFS domain-containing protein n=1 Tax=Panagrellus redivivus TaxID=6233 RepID=A0A7E4VBM8_PANRE
MSLDSNKTVIKRFTYDWLIRFAELHPFEIRGYFNQPYCPTGFYNPHRSKYFAISPFFTSLIINNMPHLVYDYNHHLQNCTIRNYTVPSDRNYNVLISYKTCFISKQTVDTISWLKDNRIIFCGASLNVFDAVVTPDVMLYVFKMSKFDSVIEVKAALTKPLMFSDIWPLISPCQFLKLDIAKLIYNENIASVFSKNQVSQTHLYLNRLNLSDDSILEMVDYFLSLPVHPVMITLGFLRRIPASLAPIINDKSIMPRTTGKYSVSKAENIGSDQLRQGCTVAPMRGTRFFIAIMGSLFLASIMGNIICWNAAIIKISELETSPLWANYSDAIANGTIDKTEIDWTDSSFSIVDQRIALTPMQISLLFATSFAGSAAFVVPATWMMRSIGTYWTQIILGGITILSAIVTPLAAVTNFWLLLVIRFVQGMCQCNPYPVIGAIVSTWASVTERGIFLAVLTGYAQLCSVITTPISSYMAKEFFVVTVISGQSITATPDLDQSELLTSTTSNGVACKCPEDKVIDTYDYFEITTKGFCPGVNCEWSYKFRVDTIFVILRHLYEFQDSDYLKISDHRNKTVALFSNSSNPKEYNFYANLGIVYFQFVTSSDITANNTFFTAEAYIEDVTPAEQQFFIGQEVTFIRYPDYSHMNPYVSFFYNITAVAPFTLYDLSTVNYGLLSFYTNGSSYDVIDPVMNNGVAQYSVNAPSLNVQYFNPVWTNDTVQVLVGPSDMFENDGCSTPEVVSVAWNSSISLTLQGQNRKCTIRLFHNTNYISNAALTFSFDQLHDRAAVEIFAGTGSDAVKLDHVPTYVTGEVVSIQYSGSPGIITVHSVLATTVIRLPSNCEPTYAMMPGVNYTGIIWTGYVYNFLPVNADGKTVRTFHFLPLSFSGRYARVDIEVSTGNVAIPYIYDDLKINEVMKFNGTSLSVDDGWPFVFYFQAAYISALLLVWILTYRDDPEKHPFVGEREIRKISSGKLTSLAKDSSIDAPNYRVLTKPAVWVCCLAAFAYITSTQFTIAFSVMYYVWILNYSITTAGILSAAPLVAQFVIQFVTGICSDKIKFLSEHTKVRICCTLAFTGCAIGYLVTSFIPPENRILSTTVILIGLSCLGFSAGGFPKSAVLIGAQKPVIVMSCIQASITLGLFSGSFIIPGLTPNRTAEEYHILFRVYGVFLITVNALFVVFCKATALDFVQEPNKESVGC